jgi:uncharacterized LabA/DUF88 family protein
MRTNVYIDGFNLFYGCLKGSPHKWLNLEALFTSVLSNRNVINRIVYCTAMVEGRTHDPDLPVRQATYLRALATLPKVEVVLGTFMSSSVRAPVVERGPDGKALKVNGKPVVKLAPSGKPVMEYVYKTEEKGSDVNLAAHLLRDAYRGDCDCAVIVSNDSDLLTPIRMVKADRNLVIGLVPPRQNGSLELKRLADFKRDIRVHQLAGAQFPQNFNDANGVITRPAGW